MSDTPSFPQMSDADARVFAKYLAQLIVEEMRSLIASESTKDWYSTDELAAALGNPPIPFANIGAIAVESNAKKMKPPANGGFQVTNTDG